MYVLGQNHVRRAPTEEGFGVPLLVLLKLVGRRHLALSQAAARALGIDLRQLEEREQSELMLHAVVGGSVAVCRWVRPFCPLVDVWDAWNDLLTSFCPIHPTALASRR